MTQTMMQRSSGTMPARQNGNGRGGPPVLAKDTATLKGMLDASADKLAMVLPRHLTPEKLMRVALVAVSRSELLQKCTVQSILQCVMIGGQLGLDCSGVLGSAYMVPFFNKKLGAYEATFIPGYRGLIDLARRSGEIEDIYAHPVYASDHFDFELGAEPKLLHKPNLSADRKDDDIVGAYMVAFLKGTTRPHIEFMPRADLLKIRDGSQSYLKDEWKNGSKTGRKVPSGPWHDHFSEMCRKTVVRRGVKYLPVSVEMADALAYDNEERTIVHAAQTGPSDRLTARLTQRPVSEGQTFEPDPAAAAEAQQQDDEPVTDIASEEIPAEVDPSGVDAEPPQQSHLDVVNGALAGAWGDAKNFMVDAAKANNIAKTVAGTGIDRFVLRQGKKGKEDAIDAATRFALYEAIVEKRFEWDSGEIIPG